MTELGYDVEPSEGFDYRRAAEESVFLTSFSVVGFDSKKKNAVVCSRMSRGVLCGETAVFYLSRDRGMWRVRKKMSLMISRLRKGTV